MTGIHESDVNLMLFASVQTFASVTCKFRLERVNLYMNVLNVCMYEYTKIEILKLPHPCLASVAIMFQLNMLIFLDTNENLFSKCSIGLYRQILKLTHPCCYNFYPIC